MEHSSRIYITSLHMKHGGVEMAIASLASALAEKGFTVEILCTYRLGEPAYPIHPAVKLTYLTEDTPNREQFRDAVRRRNPLRIFREGFRALGILRRKKQTMKRALRSIQEGTVISTRNEHSLLLSRYGAPGVKKIAQLHNDHGFDARLIRDFQHGYGNIDYFVLLTEQTRHEVAGFLKGHNSKTVCLTIPNFIAPPPPDLPAEKSKQIIAAGRLHPDKDFSSLLRIWSMVSPKHPDWTLKIAGEGALAHPLKEQARDLGIADQVLLTGALPHDQLLREMARSACYALTSVAESFGLVLVEAMSCGTPPVAFDVRVGPRAIIENGKDGFLIPNRDETRFADSLLRLMCEPEKTGITPEACRQKASRYYRENVMKQWEGLLEEEKIS